MSSYVTTQQIRQNPTYDRSYVQDKVYLADPSAFRMRTEGRRAALDLLQSRSVAPNFQVNPAIQERFRQQQQGLADMLTQRASGQSSMAAQQQRAGADAAARQAMAIAASQGGTNPGRSLRMALNAGTQANLAGNQQAAMTALAEQAQAQQALGSLLAQGRGQDIQLGSVNADLGLRGMLGYRGLENQQQLGALSALLGYDRTQNASNIAEQQLNQQSVLGQQGIGSQEQAAERDFWRRLAGGALEAGGTVLGAYVGGPAGAAAGNRVGNAVGEEIFYA